MGRRGRDIPCVIYLLIVNEYGSTAAFWAEGPYKTIHKEGPLSRDIGAFGEVGSPRARALDLGNLRA